MRMALWDWPERLPVRVRPSGTARWLRRSPNRTAGSTLDDGMAPVERPFTTAVHTSASNERRWETSAFAVERSFGGGG
jgi:hypothetical protein